MNFKRHFSVLLAIFLLISNSGMAFSIHYCGDKIASVSFKTSHNSEKDCCGINETKSHCCKNKVIHFQKKSDNLILKAFAFNNFGAFVIAQCNPIIFPSNNNFKSAQPRIYYCDAHAPPLFKQFHQYLFYA